MAATLGSPPLSNRLQALVFAMMPLLNFAPNQTQSLYLSLGLAVRPCLKLDTLQVNFLLQDAAAQSIIALKVALGRITAAVLLGSVL
jgi:hypothetical protein